MDLIYSTARALAQAIRNGEVSAVEVAETHLARIRALQPHINAVVAEAPDALDQARAADADLAQGNRARAAPRRALHSQGRVRDVRLCHRSRQPHPSTQRARRRRHRRRPHAAGRRNPARQNQLPAQRQRSRHRELHQRAHAESVRPLAQPWRQQRRRGGPHRRGRFARRPGLRPKWRRACACALLRRGRHQADCRSRAQHGRLQPARRADRPAFADRTSGAVSGGPCVGAASVHRPGCPRLGRFPGAVAGILRRACRYADRRLLSRKTRPPPFLRRLPTPWAQPHRRWRGAASK